jgi:putative FmdB family regulatory protein
MPIYEYTCQSCQSEFELLVGPSSGKPGCPDCGSKKVQKKFSTFAAHLPSDSMPACAEGACPGSGGRTSPCGGGKCPYA